VCRRRWKYREAHQDQRRSREGLNKAHGIIPF
jgi:hypothetical protein